ncbi:hypothetical protein [Nocardioides aquiterrae]|uniref:Uncharacterized protein n=1 Tax=Nocardioides aquiterrae TaxID=203799 RepID=A0ABN1UAI0_9ACTN
MSEEQHTREHTKQPVEETRPAEAQGVPHTEDLEQTDTDVQDVDMDPEDHVNRPDQPDFDPAERRPFDDPDTTLPTEHDA